MHVTGPGVSLSNQLTGPATLTGPGTSAGSSNASSGRGSFKLKNVPIVDVQDCSDMRQDGLTDANLHNTNENFGEDVDDFDEELAATMIVQSPGGFRNLVRSDVRSPTVLNPPNSTPRSTSPLIRRSNSKKNSNDSTSENIALNPSFSANSTSGSPQMAASTCTKQYLQVGNPSSIFRQPKTQVKLLKKTASVKQLYNSVLHAIKTIASSRDDIMPELTKTFFENILRASDDSPKLHVTKVKVKDGTEFGRHFCSEVHAVEVTAKLKINGESEVKKYHLIVKSQPQNEDARRFLKPSRTFEKEVQMYGQVFHDMANFVRSESIVSLNCCKDSEVIDIPRCYYTRWAGEDNVKEDLIILENLYPQGFRFAIGQDSGLNRRHAELVIRELAKFHAISYCMKKGSNDSLLNAYTYLAEDSLYRSDTSDFTKRTITPVMASLAELLRNTKKYQTHYDWFVDLARNFHDIQMEMVRPKNLFAVICHGDLWLSNILFKYSHNDQKEIRPMEVKFIDFQSARFASLATDLVLFLFTSVRTDLRREILGELISLYYATFLVSVRSLNITEDIFSMEELFIEIENYIIYGFLEGIWYLDIIHHGHVPKSNASSIYGSNGEDDMDDMNCTPENEDDLEAAEMRFLQKQLELDTKNKESQEEKDYKAEFFELLDEVLFLLGKTDAVTSKDSEGEAERKCLRDTSDYNVFQQRRNSFDSPPITQSPAAPAASVAPVEVTSKTTNATTPSTNTSR